MTFWDRLSELLRIHKLTQMELAKKLNISPSTISMAMSRGSAPSVDLLMQVSEYFKVTPRWLWCGEDPEGIDVKYAVVIRNKRLLEIGYNLTKCDEIDVAMVERFVMHAAKTSQKIIGQ